MPSAQALSSLLSTLYSCPASPELWPTFLREFTSFLDLPAAAILNHDTKSENYGIHISAGLNSELLPAYRDHFGKLDAWREPFMRDVKMEFAFGEQLCKRSILSKTEFYNDYLNEFGHLLYCAVATVKTPTSFENVSLYHAIDDDIPGQETLDRLHLVLPHLRAALKLRRQLLEVTGLAGHLADALNAFHTAVILLDEKGRCFFLNAAAERILSQHDGVYVRGSRLFAALAAESARLHALILRATNLGSGKVSCGGGAALVSRRERKPLQVTVSPLLSEDFKLPARVAAIAVISDPERTPVPCDEVLRCMYGLTPAESRVAILLASGMDLRQACEQCLITYATGRAHLRSIFDKTGVHRQAELASLLLRVTPLINVHKSFNRNSSPS
jgi:DNA-binding CsgD family transcriptional regulator/PAS domain-containing protein